jgi:hypothetical protein
MIFKIADIVVRVNKKFKLDSKFKKFYLSQFKNKPDVSIKIQKENHINLDKKSPVFKASDYWSIYSQDEKVIIKDEYNYKRIAIFNKDLKEGELFVKDNFNNYQVINPLTYPIGSVLFSTILNRMKGIFIHALGIKNKNSGILFCGHSGTGKSTLANLFQDGSKVLNDDRVILRKINPVRKLTRGIKLRVRGKGNNPVASHRRFSNGINNKFFIYGCPWHTEGEEFISAEKAELKAIFFIGHGRKNKIKKLNKREALLNIFKHAYLPIWDKKGVGLSIKLLEDIIENNNCFNLKFLPNVSVVKYLSNFF